MDGWTKTNAYPLHRISIQSLLFRDEQSCYPMDSKRSLHDCAQLCILVLYLFGGARVPVQGWAPPRRTSPLFLDCECRHRAALHRLFPGPRPKRQRCKATADYGIRSKRNDSDAEERRCIRLVSEHREAWIKRRVVPLTEKLTIKVWELEKTADIVENYWNEQSQQVVPKRQALDPFGLVSWPGAVLASHELVQNRDLVYGRTVLILGSGVGIEAQAAALLEASLVIAADVHPTTLELLAFGARDNGLERYISTELFDLASAAPLPRCDLLVAADLLYNDSIAAHVARRIVEARQQQQPSPPAVLVTDSQRFATKFDFDLCTRLQESISWTSKLLPAFRGSGVSIDEDQVYDVSARVLWIGNDGPGNYF
jgi:predicted nicotinamide N-methyase